MTSSRLLFWVLVTFLTCGYALAAGQPEIFAQLGHSENVSSIAYSPDGKTIASGGGDKSVKLWNVDTGREIRTFKLNESPVWNSVKFSPDGRYLAFAEMDGFVRLWDGVDGGEPKKIPLSISVKLEKGEFTSGSADAIVFSPDGKELIVAAHVFVNREKPPGIKSTRAFINIWDVKTGTLKKLIPVPVGAISSMALVPGGERVVLGFQEADNTVRLWDLKSGRETRRFSGHSKPVHTVVVSPDGEQVASGSEDKTAFLWDIKSGKRIKAFDYPERHERFSMAFSPDGERLAVSGSAEAEVWEVLSGMRSATLKVHGIDPWAVTFSPDGRQLALSQSNGIALWNVSAATGGRIYRTSEGSVIDRYAYSLVTTRTLGGNVKGPCFAYFSDDGKTIRSVSSIDLATGAMKSYEKPGCPLQEYADGRFFRREEMGRDNYVYYDIVDSRTDRDVLRLNVNDAANEFIYTVIGFSDDAKVALVQDKDSKRPALFDVANRKRIAFLESATGALGMSSSVSFSPDGRYVAGAGPFTSFNDNQVRVWDTGTGKLVATLGGHENLVFRIMFTPDGKHLLSGSADQTMKLWDIRSRKEVRTFRGYLDSVEAMSVSPDGKSLLSGSGDAGIKLWDMSTGRELQTFTGHTNWVTTVAFSPDGKSVLSESRDGTVRIWNMVSGKETAQFISFADGNWIVITPDGYYNSSANGDKYLNVRSGNLVSGVDQYREKFYRPEVVLAALAGRPITDLAALASVKPAPRVAIVETPASVSSEEVTVRVRVADAGGGIGDVRLYLNGSAVVLDRTRNLAVAAVQGDAQMFSYQVRLVAGTNAVRAVAFNAGNSMQSADAVQDIEAKIAAARPALHALIIGIQEYENPRLTLKYPVADAKLMASTLRERAPGLFESVNIVELTTRAQTTKNAIGEALRRMSARVRPDDLFVFFVASHGTVDDGEYFLITSNVGATSSHLLKQSALGQDDLKALIANVPATKKLVLLDTCNAGKLGEAIQVAMLTRGMNEDTAIKILSRAVGSTIISASTSVQEALEGYKDHGLFTWVVVEALKGSADSDRDGYVKTHELVNYVDSQVPELAERVFSHKQYPTTSLSGQGFPVVRVK